MRYQDIDQYILLSQKERQEHLRLDEPCVFIGGHDSREYRGLLAHFLGTTIPTGRKRIALCHACHNHLCSNVRHIYWGTSSENSYDARQNGAPTVWESMVAKYGEDQAREIQKNAGRSSWKKCPAEKRTLTGHRTPELPEHVVSKRRDVILGVDPTKFGWISRAADQLGVSHTLIRRFVNRYMKDTKVFTRRSRVAQR